MIQTTSSAAWVAFGRILFISNSRAVQSWVRPKTANHERKNDESDCSEGVERD